MWARAKVCVIIWRTDHRNTPGFRAPCPVSAGFGVARRQLRYRGTVFFEQHAQDRAMATRLVLAVAAHREIARARERGEQGESMTCLRGRHLGFWYFLANAAHSAGVVAACPSFIVSRLGARFGNQTSYQFFDENSVLGTPRGGRRTVPIRKPSFG